MRTVRITGVRECAFVERPTPSVAENYALVKIEVAPLCTEWQQFRDGRVGDVFGHEAAGMVLSGGGTRSAGERIVVMPQDACGECLLCQSGNMIRCQTPRNPFVICGCTSGRSTYADVCIQQDWLLLPIPDDLSVEHASMACCGLGPTFGAAKRMAVSPGEVVLINGLGPVGLGGVINCLARGARVIGVDANAYRADLARRLGAEAVIDPTSSTALDQVRKLTGGHGADASIETSSHPSAPAFVLEATRIGGQMTSVGWGGPVEMKDVVRRGVTVFGQWHWDHVKDAEEMFATIRNCSDQIDLLITHRFPLADVAQAWEAQISGKCGKVVLVP